MIQIPCRVCGYMLEVPQELAGTPVQCPHCHLLSDIPTLSELKQINEDGTYVINPADKAEDPYRLGEMVYVFSDATGSSISLRIEIVAELAFFPPLSSMCSVFDR